MPPSFRAAGSRSAQAGGLCYPPAAPTPLRNSGSITLNTKLLCQWLLTCTLAFTASAAEPWQSALAAMPLVRQVETIDKSNAGPLLLESFRSNAVIKAFILMPGCTDEIYFFEKVRAKLTNASPTLLDAVTALTNQTAIRAQFQPPFLLLHTTEDHLAPLATIRDQTALEKLRAASFVPQLVSFDRDWDYLLPLLEKSLNARFEPRLRTYGSWHFYRHSLAAHGLNGEETLRALALAARTGYTVKGRTLFGRPSVIFEPDRRPAKAP